jgi:hypothetical protein
MLMSALVFLIMLFMRFGPDIPFRRMLNRHLAERPVRAALGFERRQVIFLGVAAALFLLGGEMVLILGPEFLLAYAADVALYLDLLVVSTLASGMARMRGALAQGRRRLALMLRRMRLLPRGARRSRRVRRTAAAAKPANDDAGGHGDGIRMAA